MTLENEGILKFPSKQDYEDYQTHYSRIPLPNNPENINALLDLLMENEGCKLICPYPVDLTNFGAWYSEFTISNISFKQKVTSWEGASQVTITIKECLFEQSISFANSIFEQNVLFIDTYFKKHVNFAIVEFQKKYSIL